MKSISGYVVMAIVLAALGAVVLAGGRLEHRIAGAEESLAALDFVETAAAYDALDQSVALARYVPWMAGDALNRIRARRAAVRYWSGDYESLIASTRDAVEGEATDVDVLFIAANATYRLGASPAADAQSLLRSIDAARGAYQVVLRESAGHADAAFNYEFLGRLRDEVAKGRGRVAASQTAGALAPAPQTMHGREGAPPPGRSLEDFNVYVPEEPDEQGKGKEPGPEEMRRRKG